MGRRVVRLTLDNLADLPAPCGQCVFWELDPVRREAVRGHECDHKQGWVAEVLREWGSCGRVAYVDEEYAGHLIWGPPLMIPGADGFATAPVSSDAVLLASGHVSEHHRGSGLGRVLVQSMAKDVLRRHGVRAIEAFGDTRGREGHCLLPVDFLLAVGFGTHRAHATYPRMRMDLRTTLRWREELEHALERLKPRLHAPVPPQPAHPRALRDTRLTDGPR